MLHHPHPNNTEHEALELVFPGKEGSFSGIQETALVFDVPHDLTVFEAEEFLAISTDVVRFG